MVAIDMEMPDSCKECFCNWECRICVFNGKETTQLDDGRMDDCPLRDLEDMVHFVYRDSDYKCGRYYESYHVAEKIINKAKEITGKD